VVPSASQSCVPSSSTTIFWSVSIFWTLPTTSPASAVPTARLTASATTAAITRIRILHLLDRFGDSDRASRRARRRSKASATAGPPAPGPIRREDAGRPPPPRHGLRGIRVAGAWRNASRVRPEGGRQLRFLVGLPGQEPVQRPPIDAQQLGRALLV